LNDDEAIDVGVLARLSQSTSSPPAAAISIFAGALIVVKEARLSSGRGNKPPIREPSFKD